MSQNTTKFVRCCYFRLTTCFSPCSGPSSGHKSIYSWKLYSISHKIYHLKFNKNFRLIYFMNYIVSSNKYLCDLKMAQSRSQNMLSV